MPPVNRTKDASAKPSRQYMPAAQRREQILESARKVFAEKGLKGARTRELAQAAGINQATLFEHFSSKEELFSEAVVRPITALIDGARERARGYRTLRSLDERVLMSQKGIQELLHIMVDHYPLLVQVLFADPAMGEKLYREQVAPLIGTSAETMSEFIKETLDPSLIQLVGFGMFFAVAMESSLSGKSRDLADVSRQLIELMSFGCAGTAGPRTPGIDA